MRGLENSILKSYNAYVTVIVFKLARKHYKWCLFFFSLASRYEQEYMP